MFGSMRSRSMSIAASTAPAIVHSSSAMKLTPLANPRTIASAALCTPACAACAASFHCCSMDWQGDALHSAGAPTAQRVERKRSGKPKAARLRDWRARARRIDPKTDGALLLGFHGRTTLASSIVCAFIGAGSLSAPSGRPSIVALMAEAAARQRLQQPGELWRALQAAPAAD